MTPTLSQGSCQQLQFADISHPIFEQIHTLQVLSAKTYPVGTTATEAYRLIISDGTHFIATLLAPSLSHLATDLKKYTIIRVSRMSCTIVDDKRLLAVAALEVVRQGENKIGEPIALDRPTIHPGPTAFSSNTQDPPGLPESRTQAQPQGQPLQKTIHPVESLSPYLATWTIRVLVREKGVMKQYSNSRGEGKLFNVLLSDGSGSIRATAFNAAAAKFYDRLVEGKGYYISKGRVTFAKKQFSQLKNDYELSLDERTVVEECFDALDLPVTPRTRTDLDGLLSLPAGALCDVLAIVKEASNTTTVRLAKDNRDLSKRELWLVDRSGYQVRLTLWGQQADTFSARGQVIEFRNLRINEFAGRSLAFSSSSSMSIDPQVADALELRAWYDETGSTQQFQEYSVADSGRNGSAPINRANLKSISDIKSLASAGDSNASYFSTTATAVFVKHDNLLYPACQTENCKRKVIRNGDNWDCEHCHKSWDSPQYRYMITLASADHSDQAWFQGFNDVGELVFNGLTAASLHELKETLDDAKFQEFVREHSCETYQFLLRAKQEEYNGNHRVRYGISKIARLDYKAEMTYMLDKLASPWGKTAL